MDTNVAQLIWSCHSSNQEIFWNCKSNCKVILSSFDQSDVKSFAHIDFRAIFCRPEELLRHILNASRALERYVWKFKNCNQKLVHFYVGLLVFCRILVQIIGFIKSIVPEHKILKTFDQKLSKVLITRFRARFLFHTSDIFYCSTADYMIAVYEAWVINVSATVWIFWDAIIVALVPITFQIIIIKFEEVTNSYQLDNGNGDSNSNNIWNISINSHA